MMNYYFTDNHYPLHIFGIIVNSPRKFPFKHTVIKTANTTNKKHIKTLPQNPLNSLEPAISILYEMVKSLCQEKKA